MAKQKQTSLTQEQIDYIQNYEGQFQQLKTLVDAVRKMPGMYIGHTNDKGYLNVIREIFQNSVDEILRDLSPCTWIKVTFNQLTKEIIIEDNGSGIPFKLMIDVYTASHLSTNYEKELYKYTSGRHGLGAKVSNALSKKFIVESYILGEARRVEFNDGIPWDSGIKVIPNKENKQGTMVYFAPSFEYLKDITTTYRDILDLINRIIPLTKIGAKVFFKWIDETGEHDTVVENKEGPVQLISNSIANPVISNYITFGDDNGTTKADIIFTYDANNIDVPEYIISSSNYCPTDTVESSHVKGFVKGLRQSLMSYMNNIYLSSGPVGNKKDSKKKKKQITVNESDIRTGLRAAITVAHLEPNFTGQAKEILSNDDMEAFVIDLTKVSVNEWIKNNPQDLQKLCKYLKEIAELRLKSETEKVKISNQYNSALTGYYKGFTAPTIWNKRNKKEGKEIIDGEGFELFIVEGDSAGGSGKTYRIRERQGIIAIRGKILNVDTATHAKCMENEEIVGIIDTVGCGMGKNFDISKLKWAKIILTPDADPDGDHISVLLLKFVLRYMTPLVIHGKLYKSVAPLFSVKEGKKEYFFTTRIDYIKYVMKTFSKRYKVTTLKNNPLSQDEVLHLLYDNIDYIYELEKIANRYSVDLKLLELFIMNRFETVDKIEKLIKKDKRFRFVQVKSINEIPTVEGVIEEEYNTLFMNKKIIKECNRIIDILSNNIYTHYKVNDEVCSIYDIMNLFAKLEPAGLKRYKGLGEMDGEQLAETVLHPEKRVLIQYTVEDAEKEIAELRSYETKKHKLLEDLVVTRLDVYG